MNSRKAIYTFIIGDYDELKPPTLITKGWDYICFTDSPTVSSDIWEIRQTQRPADEVDLESKKFAMRHMILFYEYLRGYDLTISIGGQVQINCDLNEFVSSHFRESDDMMVCIHHERNCIYDEAEICKQFKIDDPVRIDHQMKKYRREGYPEKQGLYETGVLGMRHDRPHLITMCNIWWYELKHGSKRDQLSLNYAIWKSGGIKVSELNYNALFLENKYFLIFPHRSKPTTPETLPLESPALLKEDILVQNPKPGIKTRYLSDIILKVKNLFRH